jgi:uncharacterized linocin/CFP29 family protein
MPSVNDWGQDVWERLNNDVKAELARTRVARKFLPVRSAHPRATSVSSDAVVSPTPANPSLSIDEGAITRLNEYWVEFSLTPSQVEQETGDSSKSVSSAATTLATRAANILAQAEDTVIFNGANAFTQSPLFNPPPTPSGVEPPPAVYHRGTPLDTGLLDLPPAGGTSSSASAVQSVIVPPLGSATPSSYGLNTLAAVAQAISQLQANGQSGSYALVLNTVPYADLYAALPGTLIIPANQIQPLTTAGLYASGTLPTANLPDSGAYSGLVVSLGGDTVDLVSALDGRAEFAQDDPDGNSRFRVIQRFALRLKDPTAVIPLLFL